MTNYLILLTVISCFSQLIVAVPHIKTQCESKVASCLIIEETKKPVCGNDNQTYPSKCSISKLQCEGFTVAIKHNGPCVDKSNNRRRSITRKRNKKSCSRADRLEFSLNLLNIFMSEHDRSFGTPADEQAILEWKFNAIDGDNDGFLDEPEYRLLRRLLKKVVHPRRCARNFGRMCDSNKDVAISKAEWLSCLSRDKLTSSLEASNHGIAEGLRKPHRGQITKTKPALLLQGSLTVSANFGNLDDPIDPSKDDLDSNDCLSDRKAALDDQKNGDSVMYVPECTADGRYQNVQCYRSTGYCWCVHQDTGKPIPGTSIKDQNPKCETTSTNHRPMKGCPEQSKRKFLKDLMEFFNNERLKGMNGTGILGLKWPASREEQIASWSFVALDINKNKILERKEWKSFRVLVSENNLLRRCGKKLPRYCDINHDRKISMTEWLKCLDTQSSAHTEPSVPNTSSSSKRKGPNPLESYLKAD